MAEFLPTSPRQNRRQRMDKPPSLTPSSGPLAEELQCSVCLDVFTDPVSTPCGHNFCKRCLNQCWNNSQNCYCPFCKETFSKRPDLKINTALRQVVQLFEEKFSLMKFEFLCDICNDVKLKALKSCLVCQTSYCETHLEPHLRVLSLKKHKLMDPVENIKDYICQKHERPLELFCRDDQTYVCVFCTDGDHKTHNTVHLEEESKNKKAQLVKTQKDMQQMMQDRIRKIQDIKHSAELRKKSTEQKKAASVKLFSDLIRSIKRCQAELLEMMEEKQKAAEKQEEKLIQELQQELTELKMRNTELDHLLHTEDHLQLLQIDPSLYSPPHTRNWPEISMKTDVSVEALRRALTQLQETLDQKLSQTVMKRMQHHAVDVTLDPYTAHPNLILSDDGKQVTHGDIKQELPNNPERFDYSASVLGKKGFSLGRFYFEVQVKGKTGWTLGVARESINRKGPIAMRPQCGCWAIWLRNGNEYWACAGPLVSLSPRVKLQKVGVFVDYEEGLVSFYDVESRSHIYSFTGQSFTDVLYPYFCPYPNDKGQNSAPLIISPVNYNY
uniref:E3 ubiquitin-protein ligase TRIM39-like n=1 Tax=Cyprinus carpio TaxID=7962 RepID=A0A8C1UIS5_CYPCA